MSSLEGGHIRFLGITCAGVDAASDIKEPGMITTFVTSTPIPNDWILRIVGGSPRGNPVFRCPLVALCDYQLSRRGVSMGPIL